MKSQVHFFQSVVSILTRHSIDLKTMDLVWFEPCVSICQFNSYVSVVAACLEYSKLFNEINESTWKVCEAKPNLYKHWDFNEMFSASDGRIMPYDINNANAERKKKCASNNRLCVVRLPLDYCVMRVIVLVHHDFSWWLQTVVSIYSIDALFSLSHIMKTKP